MIKAALVVSKPYQENKIFGLNNVVNGEDNHLSIFFELKRTLKLLNIDLATQDIITIDKASIVIYNDMPENIITLNENQKAYLLALESIAVMPQNFNKLLYKNFEKIFTWYDDIIDNNKIIKINYSFKIEFQSFIDFDKKSHFLCMVCGNKFSNFSGELYYERVKLIDYLEKNRNIDFDLYGTNWLNSYKIKYYSLIKWFHKNKYLRKIFHQIDKIINYTSIYKLVKLNYSSYKGTLSPKIPKLRHYKFNICYENTNNVNGYITEKIFDCFLSGCIPIYFGAPNISNYIPNNTYIDRRNFKNNQELINYLVNFSKEDYTIMQNNIIHFLKSDKIDQFRSSHIASLIAHHINSI